LILALGQDTDTGFLKNVPGININEDGTLHVNDQMMTGVPGIFAGGDMIPSQRSVTIATGHGKKAARNIHAWLMNEATIRKEKNEIVSNDLLNVWFSTTAPPKPQLHIVPSVAIKGFDEIVSGYSEAEARYEAQRCLSCGNCFECDGCYGACPEDAIIKLGPGNRYKFDYKLCTGCAVCAEQCPCHAIEMSEEKM